MVKFNTQTRLAISWREAWRLRRGRNISDLFRPSEARIRGTQSLPTNSYLTRLITGVSHTHHLKAPYFLANGSQHAYDQVNADGATILRAETTKAVTELLAQMQSVLITPDMAYGDRQDAIRDLSLQIVTQTKTACVPLPEPVAIHWVGSTMVV